METALKPAEDRNPAGCSARESIAPESEQKAPSEGVEHNSGSLQPDAVPSTTLRKESPSPAKAVNATDEYAASPEAPVIPKGQRGKRSSRKRAASVLWGSSSSDAEDRSAPAVRSETATRAENSAAFVPEAKPDDIVNNDEAIARALAGEPTVCCLARRCAVGLCHQELHGILSWELQTSMRDCRELRKIQLPCSTPEQLC